MLFLPASDTYYDPYDVVCATAWPDEDIEKLHIWLAGSVPGHHEPIRLTGEAAVRMRAALDARVARADRRTLKIVEPPADLGTLARVAFEAYNDERGGLTWDGKPIPGWDDVGDEIRAAWMASVAATLRSVVDGLTWDTLTQ